MSKPRILAFVDRYAHEPVQALRHAGAEIAFERACTVYMGGYPPSPILIAIGPDGGQKLCQYITDWGLDGVKCIVLVGVTAPWAERRCTKARVCCRDPGTCPNERTSLGPLEPLRAVADVARRACEGWPHCTCCTAEERLPPRLVIACAPDDGLCVCGGTRDPAYERAHGACGLCSGTGKALTSADVARELMGASNGQPTSHGHTSYRWDCGGITIQVYDTRIDLAKHGLGAAIESAAQE